MKTTRFVAVTAAALATAACGTVPVEYAPASTLSAMGKVEVMNFAYLPAKAGRVAPNQLRNTALGAIKLDQNVDAFFRDAVFKELRFTGVMVAPGNKHLSGEIKEFLVDDLGYSVDWTIDVDYKITDEGGSVVYESEKVTKKNTAKFANAFAALNVQIRSNIEALIQDPEFIKSIN